jgi:fructose-1,6-bisphosphatase/inositol monophosphatase family enzyme
MQEYLQIAQDMALEAGAIMLQHFGMGVEFELKDDHTPLTKADSEIQVMVTERLTAAYPQHSLYGEEGRVINDSEFVWVFDPIDGTAAFMRGIPTNVFAIALVLDGMPILGVVYDPYMKRLYHAVRGEGAFLNGLPLKVSDRTELAGSYIDVDGYKGFANASFVERAVQEHVRILSYSSTLYAHMLVASGQLEGVFFPLKNPWDCAAAKVIVEEAGGVTSDIQGAQQRYDTETNGFISACTPAYHKKLVEMIATSL